jgi:hypothetical protein
VSDAILRGVPQRAVVDTADRPTGPDLSLYDSGCTGQIRYLLDQGQIRRISWVLKTLRCWRVSRTVRRPIMGHAVGKNQYKALQGDSWSRRGSCIRTAAIGLHRLLAWAQRFAVAEETRPRECVNGFKGGPDSYPSVKSTTLPGNDDCNWDTPRCW